MEGDGGLQSRKRAKKGWASGGRWGTRTVRMA